MGNPHFFIDIHRFLTNRAAADNQRFEILTGKGSHPLGRGFIQLTVLVNQGIVLVVICLWHGISISNLVGYL